MKVHELGELEKQVMDIVWERGISSVRDVLLRLNSKKKLAYTTVATILDRLHGKGLLLRKSKEGEKGYIYEPRVTKHLYGEKIVSSFLKTFLHSFGDSAAVSFAESIEKLPKAKREALLRLLREDKKSE